MILRRARTAQRELELSLEERERRPKLVARVGDEASFTAQALVEPAEHRVQRLAEAEDLVTGVGEREALRRGLGRDVRRSSPHRLDWPERRARQEIGGPEARMSAIGPPIKELGQETVERLVAVSQGGAYNQHVVIPKALPGGRAETPGSSGRSTLRSSVVSAVSAPETSGSAKPSDPATTDPSGPKTWANSSSPPPRTTPVPSLRTSCESVAARASEALIDLLHEGVAEPDVEERAHCGQDDGHREGEEERQSDADREPAHRSSVLSR